MPSSLDRGERGAPGLVALLGSGETAVAGRRVLGRVLATLPEPRTVVVLDTPAGFQPNARLVAEKLARFITDTLDEQRPQVQVVETRRAALGTPAGEAALKAIAAARCIVSGPGSPTYMIRELRGTPYWEAIRGAYRGGTAICLASAATLAASAQTIPVYEIFKAGEEPSWWEGLDLLGEYGLRLALAPHWNNREGGAELDTSHCFLGEARFAALYAQLPSDVTVLAIDEHTGCILDFASGSMEVLGTGGAQVLREGRARTFASGGSYALALLRDGEAAEALEGEAWTPRSPFPADDVAGGDPLEAAAEATGVPGALVDSLLTIRSQLRAAKQWAFADRIRDALAAASIVVEDTPEGSRWHTESTR